MGGCKYIFILLYEPSHNSNFIIIIKYSSIHSSCPTNLSVAQILYNNFCYRNLIIKFVQLKFMSFQFFKMTQQHQKHFEEEEDNSTIAVDEFVQLDPTTPNGTNDGNPHDVLSSPVYSISSDGDDDLNELKSKMRALEVKNQALEGSLEKLELKVKIYELKEQNAQMANNRFESTIQVLQKEMAILKEQNEQQQKEPQQTIKLDDSKSHLDEAVIVNNPLGNRFICSDKTNPLSPDGLRACTCTTNDKWRDIFAEKGFLISGQLCRSVVYYFEVERTSLPSDCGFRVGLSNGSVADSLFVGTSPNSYAIQHCHDNYFLSGTRHWFEWLTGAIRPKWNGCGDVMGCGILLNAKNEVAIFFTANGILMGKQIPIIHPAGDDRLFPTVSFRNSSLEANFGNDSSKPFKYDVVKCPGLIQK